MLAAPAHATYTLTIKQIGPNVVASGSGTIDTGDLRYSFTGDSVPFLLPLYGDAMTGAAGPVDTYFTGQTGYLTEFSFGPGGVTDASSGAGDIVYISGLFNEIYLPAGYRSGDFLSSLAVYDAATFQTLGLTSGTYVASWGATHADSFVVDLVPEPATWAMLMGGFGLIGAALRFRRRMIAAA
jgi:hypothetical protein